MEKDILYFKSDLKNYIDRNTGLTPVESFFKNILENIGKFKPTDIQKCRLIKMLKN